MATHNGERFLEHQLWTLEIQWQQPLEVVVADDCSTDRTLEILEAFAGRAKFPVTILRNETRLGYGATFMRAAKVCSGEWIAFCDQDDSWSPGKLRWVAEQITDEINLIAHNAVMTDETLKPTGMLYAYPESVTGPMGLPPEWHCTGMTQIFRRTLLEIPSDRRPSFPWHPHKRAHDVWIALIANAVGGVLRTNDAFVFYRRHGGTVTDNGPAPSKYANHGSEYPQRAQYLEEVAAILEKCSQTPTRYAQRLDWAAKEARRQAHLLAMRGEVYSGGRLHRLGAAAKLTKAGGYRLFGLKRMAKDVIIAAAGR